MELQVSLCLLPLLAHRFLLGKGSVLFISELSMSGTAWHKIDANSVLSVNEKEEEYEIAEGCQVYLRGSPYSCLPAPPTHLQHPGQSWLSRLQHLWTCPWNGQMEI